MAILIAVLAAVALFIWYSWGRARARREVGTRLDTAWARLVNRRKCDWQRLGIGRPGLNEFR